MLSGKMQSASYVKPDVLAVSHVNAPYISAYPWYEDGFGTKFADPTTPMTSTGGGVAFHPSGNAVAVANSSGNFSVYQWEGLGFGAKYVNPTDLINPAEVLFSPDGNVIFVGFSAYAWSSSGFGAPYTNFTTDVGFTRSTGINPAGTVFTFSYFTRGVAIYGFRRWSNATGFGTAYTVPFFWASDFSPDNSAVTLTSLSAPHVTAYQWSDATGLGTQYANPATPIGNSSYDGVFSPDGTAVAYATTGFPYVAVYAWSGAGFGTRYANPATPASFYGERVAFNGSGTALAVACTNGSTSPTVANPVTVYQWSSAGFGTKFADPATPPTGNATGVAFLSNPS